MPIMVMSRKTMPEIRTFTHIVSCLLGLVFSLISVADEDRFFDLVERANQKDWVGRKVVINWSSGECMAFELMVIHKSSDKYYQHSIYPESTRANRNQPNDNERRVNKGQRRSSPPFRPPRSNTKLSAFSLVKHQQLIRNNYDLQLIDDNTTICGRETQLWSITPHQAKRNKVFKVWLDSETGILLQSEKKDGHSRRLSVLTQLQFDPQLVADQLAKMGSNERPNRGDRQGRSVSKLEAQKALNQKLNLPDGLFSGFQIEEIELMERLVPLSSSVQVVHTRYTDGLEVISVFQSLSSADRNQAKGERRSNRLRGRRKPRAKRQNISGIQVTSMERIDVWVYQWRNNGIDFTLIGSLTQSEMDQMAKSLIQ